MSRTVSANRVATLVSGFDRQPAYAGLADALRLAIGDGRIGYDVRLPSERELTSALGVSRTTVTRAYELLRETGYAAARRGAGTYTRVPGGRARSRDRGLHPRTGADEDLIDLGCAAAPAPPGVAAAYAAALDDLPAHLGSHGYHPLGLPELQAAIADTFVARGLPTDPDQVMVTPGALTAAAVVAHARVSTGDRVLVESPTYPNATDAIRHSGARLVGSPVGLDGWDVDGLAATLRQTAPRLAYLIPDFQNPTGRVMTDAERETLAAHLGRTRTTAVVDEAHQGLALDGQTMPRPFAAHAPATVTIGSASKSHWGGLRLGWIRAPRGEMERLLQARVGLDLGAPVLEQLVLARLLREGAEVTAEHRSRLRTQRDHLVRLVHEHLPDWGFRVPAGGLALWCELPTAQATAVTEAAERLGVAVAPGPLFAVEGGLDRYVRIPWTRPVEELEEAVRRLARAWSETTGGTRPGPEGRQRIMVA
ncbi:PLP-dependent aminotransferase family protein [Nocardioides coralli]|uniref:MocR-like transcription factor YczR n=1 Tax=Nocardioides coralli TaxID=2872154 RepID=UPI001CA3B98B|nr:PLP-dependent aminotransferase family protein [Nocardioides coralli]QZY28218.1 PLP-dependent aminotransferase family protein [Nocardioides coralli]